MELMLGLGLLGALFAWGVAGWWRCYDAERRLMIEKTNGVEMTREAIRLENIIRDLAQRLVREQTVSQWVQEIEDAANNLR